jgi:hypothetical protein
VYTSADVERTWAIFIEELHDRESARDGSGLAPTVLVIGIKLIRRSFTRGAGEARSIDRLGDGRWVEKEGGVVVPSFLLAVIVERGQLLSFPPGC